jgi:hypothetical protein
LRDLTSIDGSAGADIRDHDATWPQRPRQAAFDVRLKERRIGLPVYIYRKRHLQAKTPTGGDTDAYRRK